MEYKLPDLFEWMAKMKKFLFILGLLASTFMYTVDVFETVSPSHCDVNEGLLGISKEELTLYHKDTMRPIPVYRSAENKSSETPLSHYQSGLWREKYKYSFIAKALAEKGYTVISVQHDLKGDPDLPRIGNLYEKRMPFWSQGTLTINVVLRDLDAKKFKYKRDKVILIGHSNGGDLSLRYASQFPQHVEQVISLDSLRYLFPKHVEIFSLRAEDTCADPGVIPSQRAKIIPIKGAKHIDMTDEGPENVKLQILNEIIKFL